MQRWGEAVVGLATEKSLDKVFIPDVKAGLSAAENVPELELLFSTSPLSEE
jgi:hypothetical protein